MIVPDNVLDDADAGLAVAVERDYELLGLWRYPEPEYQEFQQCVLRARRYDKALNKTKITFPRWASEPTKWPVLRDDMKPVVTLDQVQTPLTLRPIRLDHRRLVTLASPACPVRPSRPIR
jgi:hypothetical protein